MVEKWHLANPNAAGSAKPGQTTARRKRGQPIEDNDSENEAEADRD